MSLVESEIVGRQCLTLVNAKQTVLRGGFKLRSGELATCEMILTDVVTGVKKWAILNWNRLDHGECQVGVDVKHVRVWDGGLKRPEVKP